MCPFLSTITIQFNTHHFSCPDSRTGVRARGERGDGERRRRTKHNNSNNGRGNEVTPATMKSKTSTGMAEQCPGIIAELLLWNEVENQSCRFEEAFLRCPNSSGTRWRGVHSEENTCTLFCSISNKLSEKQRELWEGKKWCNSKKRNDKNPPFFIYLENRKVKVERRNSKASLNVQPCFPLFAPNTSVDRRRREK